VPRSEKARELPLEGLDVRSLDELLTHVESRKPGERVTLTIRREGQLMDVAVQLEQAPN